MSTNDAFKAECQRLKDRILDACEPDDSSEELGVMGYAMAIGATYTHLLEMHIEFLAGRDESFAREVLDAHEADLVSMRKRLGWLQG